MNCQTRSLLASLALHGGLIAFAINLSSGIAHEPKTVSIDFTILDSSGSPPPGPPSPTTAPRSSDMPKRQSPPPEKTSQIRTVVPVERPREQVVAARPAPAPTPAIQPDGAIPVAAAPAASVSQPAQKAEGSGTGAGGGISGSGSGTGAGHGRSGSGSGTGDAEGQARNRYLNEHFEYIKNLIQNNLTYPARARRMGWTGKVVVKFLILENGHVVNTEIVSSSGYGLLDDKVVETIRSVEPFPKPPVRAELKIPITFRLE